MSFPPIAERLGHVDLTAWVASDTIETLAAHVAGIVAGTDGKRRLTMIRRYRHAPGEAPTVDRGLSGLRVETGLTLEDPTHLLVDPIEHWTQTTPAGRGLAIHLQPGIAHFGFAAYDKDGTEEEKRAAYWAQDPAKDSRAQRRNLTKVTCSGFPGSPRRGDRISIEHWNTYGVCEDIVLLFDDIWDDEA